MIDLDDFEEQAYASKTLTPFWVGKIVAILRELKRTREACQFWHEVAQESPRYKNMMTPVTDEQMEQMIQEGLTSLRGHDGG